MRIMTSFGRLCFGVMIIVGLADGTPAQAQRYEKIDCSQSRLAMAPMKTCRKGPIKDYGNAIHCLAENYTATATTKDRSVFAYLLTLNKKQSDGSCFINDLQFPDNIKRINKPIRNNADNWSGLEKISDVQGFRFDFPKRKCSVTRRSHGKSTPLRCEPVSRVPLATTGEAFFSDTIKRIIQATTPTLP